MEHQRVGQAVFAQQAPLISRTTWGDFADKMRGRVDADMSGEDTPFTSADHRAPTEPDHSAFWEYIEDLPTSKLKSIEDYSTAPMISLA